MAWGRSQTRYASYGYGGFPPYVPVAERRAATNKQIAALVKKGREISPVSITGKKIATTFWGVAWCENLEAYSDYASRLPRGRTYVRNGSVAHLAMSAGKIDALVSGSELYTIEIKIETLGAARWKRVVEECSGKVTSLVELLAGRLDHGVMEIVTDAKRGLFPGPREIERTCSCPDWATMCKHVAATLYAVGARLDSRPELLFVLRGVDAGKLLSRAAVKRTSSAKGAKKSSIASSALGGVFGIDMDDDIAAAPTREGKRKGASKRSPAK